MADCCRCVRLTGRRQAQNLIWSSPSKCRMYCMKLRLVSCLISTLMELCPSCCSHVLRTSARIPWFGKQSAWQRSRFTVPSLNQTPFQSTRGCLQQVGEPICEGFTGAENSQIVCWTPRRPRLEYTACSSFPGTQGGLQTNSRSICSNNGGERAVLAFF